ncbi:hypothetical protein WICMUC_003321 [Wickerhamomyces mucosus]|uniref:Uncharacterized protein n=1 Tax=Wickerhamomyces mucosus TaxID=1378264 RepID=A0A9P8PLR2_9ASCO|nr:hypothetical protein WICMUC_003321 [Wickerhamomyces mucosus]
MPVGNFYLQAIEEEESGDRFKLSDLTKSLRFYESSYQSYLESIKLEVTIDNTYNLYRLIYDVYSGFTGNSFSLRELNLTNFDVLKYNLPQIKKLYDLKLPYFKTVERVEFGKIYDFQYNLVLINLELIENFDSDEIKLLEKGYDGLIREIIEEINEILEYQLEELQKLLDHIALEENENEDGNGDNSKPPAGFEEGQEEEEFDMIEQVTPDVILDTLIQAYKMINAVLENTANLRELTTTRDSLEPFKNKLDEITKKITDLPYERNEESINEIKLLNHSIISLFYDNEEAFIIHWKNIYVDDSIALKSSFVDSLSNFKKFNNIDNISVLNQVSQTFKEIEILLKDKIQNNPQVLELSDYLIRLIEIFTNRSDIELTKFNYTKNEVNLTNSLNILKTALNYLNNVNCGLRETLINKLIKKRLKRQLVLRILILQENGINESKIKETIGEQFYQEDLEILGSVDIYSEIFGI